MLSPNLVVETCWGEGLERLPEILDAREAMSPPSSFEISKTSRCVITINRFRV
jgi:hypothetical protein